MKTTYVLDTSEVKLLKLQIIQVKKIIWYFLNRKKVITWDPDKNIFKQITGLIDIAATKEILMEPDEAKNIANRRNVKYLVRRKSLNSYYWKEINQYGTLSRVIGEYVEDRIKLIDEYHLVFDEKIDKVPPFKFRNVFYGNIFDYLEQKKAEEFNDSRNIEGGN